MDAAKLKGIVMKLTAKEKAEMYRLMRRVHRLKATRTEQSRYMVLSRQDDFARSHRSARGVQ